jgi:nicotinamidase-related amidase
MAGRDPPTAEGCRFALLIIDPQVDFHPGGALPVSGSDEDAARLHNYILANVERITSIYVTLDSHQVR